jgi:DNA invertase Pin-like site-specific DNA recombinase
MTHNPFKKEKQSQPENYCKTRQELAEEFRMSRSTFYRTLKKHGVNPPNGLLSPYWVSKIQRVMSDPE